ncbi:MAG TPA: APC family permease [Roseiflexaceae bacterium]
MSVADRLFGRRLATYEEEEQRVGPLAGIPLLGLDALSSSAYGPEAALTLLLPLGALGVRYMLPITTVIVGLLLLIYLSYRQTIAAYPSGGGSYTVAKENLGTRAGLIAAVALMLDYILNVAVGISAGGGALVSALPQLQPYTLPLCLAVLALITFVNLRGVRESGLAFMLPTYLFIGCILMVLAIGVVKTLLGAGHPAPVVAPPALPPATTAVSMWLLLRAFANGCTAMTGVEAVSNGVSAFRSPAAVQARRTLTAIVGILIVLLAGITFLARAYGIGATTPGRTGYESVLSQLVAAVVGRSFFYYLTIGALLVVLALSANTSFAGFPRLCQVIARDDFLPNAFAHRGRRLVFSLGIYALAGCAAVLLIAFGGITDRLIPLFAVGALLAFTVSQAGMVAHWWRTGGRHARRHLLVNGIGAAATGLTLAVVLVAKFTEGAWITLLLIPTLLVIFSRVHRHYAHVDREIACVEPLNLIDLRKPIVVVPIRGWDMPAHKALRFALKLSADVYAVQIRTDESGEDLRDRWAEFVEAPAHAAGLAPPHLDVIPSPYRRLFSLLFDYIGRLKKEHPDRQIAVIVPELVEHRWYHYLLHNQRAQVLKTLLMLHGGQRVVVINVPWYLTA